MILGGLWACALGTARADERDDFFEAKIRPVLAGTCFRCHGDSKTGGALRVDSREALLKGGESGPALTPGKPDDSLLIRAIQRRDDVSAMPPEKDKALRADQVADFVTWIKSGAVWPAKSARFVAAKHWAFEPVRDVAPPDVQDPSWVRTSIDRFVRAKQEAAGIRPAPVADKLTLIRRATYDLTGLPPTPEDVQAFLQDSSPQAFATVVDRLLKSPAYGERWGRHWLDVVRYADTAGETADYPVPLAWRYRNYVIDAFNADKPYDEFLREQIAGDVLASRGPREQYAERVTATGYLAISRRFGFDSENYHHLTIQDTIDTLGQTVLGLSLGCARCHDHKFDAVSMLDYYALYGIFDSSRYPFPGSEQKQKVRSLAPLIPPSESQAGWHEYAARVADVAGRLARNKQPVSPALLRSLTDCDGDFELQAAAAGGSNGVLVSPWLYQGKVSVTNAAQSPYKNYYASGKSGVSVPAGSSPYRFAQALYPRRTRENGRQLHVNLDFRVAAPDASARGEHRVALGAIDRTNAVELIISADAMALRVGETVERLRVLTPNTWHNVQLTIDLQERTVTGRVGVPDATSEFAARPISSAWSGSIELVAFESHGAADAVRPAIEFDNFGVRSTSIPPVSTELPRVEPDANSINVDALAGELQALVGIDGDLELQARDKPPASPWNPGPNSVVKLSPEAQSPYRNVYAPGELGLHLPNRGEYDGFGLTLTAVKPDQAGKLFVGFDFRCVSQEAGGAGSWRYYLGHGPGNSAAIELFFNGSEFFRRSGAAKESVGRLAIGQWYQVQLTLDLNAKTYVGTFASPASTLKFSGELATGWDGTIDYSFIDSYGHIGGVRPSLDADNFVLGDKPLPPFDAPAVQSDADAQLLRRTNVDRLRRQLASLQTNAGRDQEQLNQLLAEGPFPLAYGMAEGTPHKASIHLRGEPDRLGSEVPRGFIRVLGGGPLPTETRGSGRLELAQWLTRPDNPLTARVMVNRIWQYHFGRGIVATANDFGVRGLPPTHPELLDHLATQFVRDGWSIKSMHRLIMLSATYQQAAILEPAILEPASSDSPRAAASSLPPAELYARFVRRRLSAEEIRDAILAVSGELDLTPAREHPFPSPITWGYTQHGPFNAVYDHNRRSVYLMTQRLKRHPFLALFDGPDPNATTAERLATTVPTQALFFLNDPFVHAKAEKWAARLVAASADERPRIELAWRRAVGRVPSADEWAEASEFLKAYRTAAAAEKQDQVEQRALAAYLRAIFSSNEFLHVD